MCPSRVALSMMLIGAVGSHADAQSIRGRILLPDGVTPSAGIVVSAQDSAGTVIGNAQTNSAGAYTIPLPGPGLYRIRVLRIGFRPLVGPQTRVGSEGFVAPDVTLAAIAVRLAAASTRERDDCTSVRATAQSLVVVWEQAQAALTAATITERRGQVRYVVLVAGGHEDAVTYHAGEQYARARNAEIDSTRWRQMVSTRPFDTAPPESLLATGYIHRIGASQLVFDSPSAELVLADRFAAMHCFSLVDGGVDHPAWIGLHFEPRSTSDSLREIRGTLWLDTATAELRRLEFKYVAVDKAWMTLCDRRPDTEARLTRPCERYIDFENMGLGGEMDFRRLAGGQWIVTQWTVRTYPDAQVWRRTGLKHLVVGSGARCTEGPNCRDLWAPWPRLVTRRGSVAAVTDGGVTIYEDSATIRTINALSAQQAGSHEAQLRGIVTDANRVPLSNVMIQIEDLGRAAVSDTAGAFAIQALPARAVNLTLTCPGYATSRVTLNLFPDSTRAFQLRLLGTESTTAAKCTAP